MSSYVTHLRIQTTDPEHSMTVEIDTVPEAHFEEVILNGPEPFIRARERGRLLWINKSAIESLRPVSGEQINPSPFPFSDWPTDQARRPAAGGRAA